MRSGRKPVDMVTIEPFPQLHDPVVVTAFEGWNDAGDAASAALDHLATVLHATTVVALDPEEYYDYQVNRPMVSLAEDGSRRLAWPTTRIAVVRGLGQDAAAADTPGHGSDRAGSNAGGSEGGAAIAGGPLAARDLILVRGIEPSMRWRRFSEELLELFDELGARLVVHLGALLADVPHTRPVPVTGTASAGSVADDFGLETSRYEGPTGILGVLQDAGDRRDLPTVSLWAAVPHYVAQTPCPKASLALLRRIEDLLDITIPLGDLPEQARAWERGVDELAREDSEVAEYVQSLETAKDTVELPEASGDAIAREFERYLRRRPGHRDGGSPA